MKRFFQAAPKDASFKKLCSASDSSTLDNGVSGAMSSEACEEESGSGNEDPTTFMSWNANSFLLRLKNDKEAFLTLVREKDPDVIAIQEVRVPAAGAKGELKRRGSLKDDTKEARDDKQIITRAFSSPPLSNYSVFWSLSDNKYGGTALLVKKRFNPSVTYSLESGKGQRGSREHNPDGRVILAEFPSLRVLNTYVPNNGWKDDALSFQRRRKWDKCILEFVSTSSPKPLIWCGDLNVSHTDLDVSHPDFFRNAKQPGYIPPDPNDCGQPGFTPNEQRRFSEILSRGGLIDAYRHLHKDKDMEAGFSWSGNPVGKYRGKRMRIDYFLISTSLAPRLHSCEMEGRGIELVGFVGSDHCPLTMTLSKLPEAAAIADDAVPQTGGASVVGSGPTPVHNPVHNPVPSEEPDTIDVAASESDT